MLDISPDIKTRFKNKSGDVVVYYAKLMHYWSFLSCNWTWQFFYYV